MSRALDVGVKESLERGNHQEVYNQISEVLTSPTQELLEIELLGQGSIFDNEAAFLQDGSAVAISKIRLVQAFIVARQLLWGYLTSGIQATESDILKATAVMLLMDPEHLTAANTRKRIIQKKIASGTNTEVMLTIEKHLVDSFLTSRLHRHTKSPTLWNHRRWLMNQCQACSVIIDAETDLQTIIMVSGERHPRNYYAWCHARYLTNTFVGAGESMSRIILGTKHWCFMHHDDISGWQFLAFLLQRHTTERASVVSETLRLAESFKWRNESAWYFLRNMAPALQDGERDELVRVKAVLHESAAPDSQDRTTLNRALQWAGLE